MPTLLDTQSITAHDLQSIFRYVQDQSPLDSHGTVACSFQGMGTRTRTTFIQAIQQLGLSYITLPTFLDTAESPRDLAGYLDVYYDLYVIRYGDHAKLADFAYHSQRPVINAMSAREHPCEAIADAYWFDTTIKPLKEARVVVWGPMTNVLRSWQNVATAAGADVRAIPNATALPNAVDLVITDGWPAQQSQTAPVGLELDHLLQMGNPVLLPTPPFTVGAELTFDPLTYPHFAGYSQKAALLDVQKAIIRWALES